MDPKEMQERIEAALPGAMVRVEGAEAHFSAIVIAKAFEGKSRIEQHQMIYALFKKEMDGGQVHALQLRTVTPSEWEKET